MYYPNRSRTHMEKMEIDIISFLVANGDKCNIYEILENIEDFHDKEQFYASELRIVLKRMELAGLIDVSNGNGGRDKYGFRPIAQIVVKV